MRKTIGFLIVGALSVSLFTGCQKWIDDKKTSEPANLPIPTMTQGQGLTPDKANKSTPTPKLKKEPDGPDTFNNYRDEMVTEIPPTPTMEGATPTAIVPGEVSQVADDKGVRITPEPVKVTTDEGVEIVLTPVPGAVNSYGIIANELSDYERQKVRGALDAKFPDNCTVTTTYKKEYDNGKYEEYNIKMRYQFDYAMTLDSVHKSNSIPKGESTTISWQNTNPKDVIYTKYGSYGWTRIFKKNRLEIGSNVYTPDFALSPRDVNPEYVEYSFSGEEDSKILTLLNARDVSTRNEIYTFVITTDLAEKQIKKLTKEIDGLDAKGVHYHVSIESVVSDIDTTDAYAGVDAADNLLDLESYIHDYMYSHYDDVSTFYQGKDELYYKWKSSVDGEMVAYSFDELAEMFGIKPSVVEK